MAASRIANIIVRLPFLTFLSFCPGMAESSVLAAGAVKLPYDLPGNMGILLDNHLAYTISVIDGKILLAEIDKNYTHLSAIVGVNSARTVGDAYAALQSQTGPRADLAFISRKAVACTVLYESTPFQAT